MYKTIYKNVRICNNVINNKVKRSTTFFYNNWIIHFNPLKITRNIYTQKSCLLKYVHPSSTNI
jgi:hypothetical protein